MYQNLQRNEDFIIPQTGENFDQLVDAIVFRYAIPDRSIAEAVVANQIQRLPADQCYVTLDYLGNSVLKSIGYGVALHKSRMLNQKIQIDNIAAALVSNPHDQQALDALETASKDGSDYAKEILSLYRPVDAGDNVLQMNPLATHENKGLTV